MNSKIRSLATDATYAAFVARQLEDTVTVIVPDGDSVKRFDSPALFSALNGLNIALEGDTVLQARVYDSGQVHVQYRGDKANRDYGAAFNITDANLAEYCQAVLG